jgi:hypothetical protein
MREPDAVASLIERIVSGARIPSRARREDLRRELRTHFEEAGSSPEAVQSALLRFGDETALIESLRRVYRFEFALLYAAKVAASLFASVAAAVLIQVLVSMEVSATGEGWRVTPGFLRGVGVSVAVVLGLVAVWEAARRPFRLSRAFVAVGAYTVICLVAGLIFAPSIRVFVTASILVVVGYACSRLQPRPARLLLLFVAFAAALYANHLSVRVVFGPGRAMLGSAILVMVWSSTILVLNRTDRIFSGLFQPRTREWSEIPGSKEC